MTRSRLLALAVPAVVAAVLAPSLASPPPAAAQCILVVQFRGADYVATSLSDPLDPADLAGVAGTGALPACTDVVTLPPQPVPPATPVTVRRIRGVALRFAVAYDLPGAGPLILSPAGVGCIRRTTAATLACLRRATVRLDDGPSLIAPAAAHPGDVVPLTVHVRNRVLRGLTSSGIDAVLQGPGAGGRWVSLWHLLRPSAGETAPPAPVAFGPPFTRDLVGFGAGFTNPVRLPDLSPGRYRIADHVVVRGRLRWITAPLTVTAP